MSESVPIPPLELRRTSGPVKPEMYDNPTGRGVFDAEGQAPDYAHVIDFGCGCGRIARQMIQQKQRPETYFGFDLNEEVVQWCDKNLRPEAPGFTFKHIDIYNRKFNPSGSQKPVAFSADDETATFILAHSVFTHVLEKDVEFYLQECARVTRTDAGLFRSTWFFFDKRFFPMMQDYQNAIYINHVDPSNAVIFDLDFIRAAFARAGLKPVHIIPPKIRGFQWVVYCRKTNRDVPPVEWPDDLAPFGKNAPPHAGVKPDR